MGVSAVSLIKDVGSHKVKHFYATAASTTYLDGSSFTNAGGIQSIAVQSNVAVQIFRTLSPTSEALNGAAEVQAGVLWSTATALVANAITPIPGPFTALKIVFPAAGELHIAVD